MSLLNRSCRRVTLCAGALSLCFSLSAGADEIQDINKLFNQKEYAPALELVNTYLANKPKDAKERHEHHENIFRLIARLAVKF